MVRNKEPHNPRGGSSEKNEPVEPSKAMAAIVNWLEHYWEAPREKAKWSDIAIVLLTIVVAGAAIYSAWIFQGQLDEMRHQLRQDQRSWVFIRPKGEFVGTNGLPRAVGIDLDVTNEGKTLARNVLIGTRVEFVPNGKSPNLGDTIYGPATFMETGMILPNESKTVVIRRQHRKEGAPNNSEDYPLTDAELAALRAGGGYIAEYSIVKYEDIFHVQHWTKFCVWYSPAIGSQMGGVHPCAAFNQTDDT